MKLYYYYDKGADVLYLSQGKPSSRDESQEIEDDIVLRLDSKTHKVRGFTILNFTRRMKQKDKSVSLPLQMELTPA